MPMDDPKDFIRQMDDPRKFVGLSPSASSAPEEEPNFLEKAAREYESRIPHQGPINRYASGLTRDITRGLGRLFYGKSMDDRLGGVAQAGTAAIQVAAPKGLSTAAALGKAGIKALGIGLAEGVVGGYAARKGAEALGVGEGGQEFAEFVGGAAPLAAAGKKLVGLSRPKPYSPGVPRPTPTLQEALATEGIQQAALAPEAEKALAKRTWGQRKAAVKKAIVDSFSPVEDRLTKESNQTLLPSQHITNKIDEALKSDDIGIGRLKALGYDEAIQSLEKEDLPQLSEYMKAKRLLELKRSGHVVPDYLPGGLRNEPADLLRVTEDRNRYEAVAKKMTEINNQILRDLADAGVLSKKEVEKAIAEYPDYTIIHRVTDDSAKPKDNTKGRALLDQARQVIFQSLDAGNQPIVDPLLALQDRAKYAAKLIKRNEAIRTVLGYGGLDKTTPTLPEFTGVFKRKKFSSSNIDRPGFITYYRNGKMKQVEVTVPEIASAMQALNKPQLTGLLAKATGFVRAIKTGITGTPQFAFTNLFRDQSTGLMNAQGGLVNYIQNLKGAGKIMFEVLGHGKIYQELEARGALGSSFDLYRGPRDSSVERVWAQKNAKESTRYSLRNPKDLARKFENLVAGFEEATRAQQWQVGFNQAKAKGLSDDEAKIAGDNAARWVTAPFHRSGDWGPVANSLILFFNANIQGQRASFRRAADHPLSFATKYLTLIGMPVASLALWNLSDPERRKVYSSLTQSTRDNNYVVVLPGASVNPETRKAEKVWTLPLPPGISRAVMPFRRAVEAYYDIDPLNAKKMLNDFVSATLPYNVFEDDIISSLLHPAVKPAVEVGVNRTTFPLGRPIESDRLLDEPMDKRIDSARTGEFFKGLSSALHKVSGSRLSPPQLRHLSRGYLGRFYTDLLDTPPTSVPAAGDLFFRRFAQPYALGEREREEEAKRER